MTKEYASRCCLVAGISDVHRPAAVGFNDGIAHVNGIRPLVDPGHRFIIRAEVSDKGAVLRYFQKEANFLRSWLLAASDFDKRPLAVLRRSNIVCAGTALEPGFTEDE